MYKSREGYVSHCEPSWRRHSRRPSSSEQEKRISYLETRETSAEERKLNHEDTSTEHLSTLANHICTHLHPGQRCCCCCTWGVMWGRDPLIITSWKIKGPEWHSSTPRFLLTRRPPHNGRKGSPLDDQSEYNTKHQDTKHLYPSSYPMWS